jgi:hypothetical protein
VICGTARAISLQLLDEEPSVVTEPIPSQRREEKKSTTRSRRERTKGFKKSEDI